MCPNQCRPVEGAGAPSQGAAELNRLSEELQSLNHQNAELRGALQDACLSTLQPDAAQYVQVRSLHPQSWQLLYPCLHTAPRIQLRCQAECLLRACTILDFQPSILPAGHHGQRSGQSSYCRWVLSSSGAPCTAPAQPALCWPTLEAKVQRFSRCSSINHMFLQHATGNIRSTAGQPLRPRRCSLHSMREAM